jgi:UDP-N-acetylmuramate: L-alanyl-gamma-D-glutamyl-meso-diaminopimelate ligase
LIFGKHNLQNLNGARLVCNQLGITNEAFFRAICSFKGASKRLELVAGNDNTLVFKDFAHAPSKLRATTQSVKEQFPGKALVACMELHTYSSLSRDFLSHYKASMDAADRAIVYFSPHALALKRLPEITADEIREGFGRADLDVYSDPKNLLDRLLREEWSGKVLLMMSSGNFDGIDILDLANRITEG